MNMRLVRFTKGLLDIMFYVGMAITAAIPVLFHYVGMYREIQNLLRGPVCAVYGLRGAGTFAGIRAEADVRHCAGRQCLCHGKCGILETNGKMQLPHSHSVGSAPFCGAYAGHGSDYYCIFDSRPFLFRALSGI